MNIASVYKKARDKGRMGASYYLAYTDEAGKRHNLKVCPDKAASEAMARKIESDIELRRRGVIDPRADAYARHEATPLSDYLAAFEASLVAKGGCADHPPQTRKRCELVIGAGGIRRVSDLAPSRVDAALIRLRAERGLGKENVNHYIRAIKGFARWLWRDGRARDHLLAHLATSSPEGNRRERRALAPAEVARLLGAAEAGPVVQGLDGTRRALLYRVALGTGLRARELATLTPERFRLDATPPTATVRAGYTKNGRLASQPLPPGLVARLRPVLAALAPGEALFPLGRYTADMIRIDLEAAGVPYETDVGVADFHSLQGCYVTDLTDSGASVKTVQALARHSTPALTIGVYAKARPEAVAGAVADLPDHEALAAQGQRVGDGSGRLLSNSVGTDASNAAPDGPIQGRRKHRTKAILDGSCRPESAPGGDDAGGGRAPARDAQIGISNPAARLAPV